jgi:WhiB family redox-sensing transcriptional regulator
LNYLVKKRPEQLTLRPIFDLWEWQQRGACVGADPEIFYLEEGMRLGTKTKREQQAKKMCSTCPVIEQCRSHALNIPEQYGVWGGLSADERDLILKTKGE